MSWELVIDVLRNSVLITGLVIIMMLMIEYINISSKGKWFKSLQSSRTKQVFLGAALGLVPGCIGGFAAVSLYTHRLISFGALIAMMIASSGDEAFVMLAMIPKDGAIIMGVLFVIAVVVGLIINLLSKKESAPKVECTEDFEIHSEDCCHIEGSNDHHHEEEGHHHGHSHKSGFFCKERIILLVGISLFIAALAFGMLEHNHAEGGHHEGAHSEGAHSEVVHSEGAHSEAVDHIHTAECSHAEHFMEHNHTHDFNLLDEYWINLIFAILSLFAIYFVATSNVHFIKEHLWNHVIKKHLLSIFCWTFGALIVIQIGLQYMDIEVWTKANIPFIILLAALIGIIPESGPHMIFITLFAGGLVPFSVLLTSSISQDGHSALPLLAESKSSFFKSKLINLAIALLFGFGLYFCGF